LKIDPEQMKYGLFIWEDHDENLHVGMTENIEDDVISIISLLTDAINSITIDFLKHTAH
jgi:hypothetical protein